MKQDKDLRWGDAVTALAERRLLETTKASIPETIARLKELDRECGEQYHPRRLGQEIWAFYPLGAYAKREFFLTEAGPALRVTRTFPFLRPKATETLLEGDEIEASLKSFEISAPDLAKTVEWKEDFVASIPYFDEVLVALAELESKAAAVDLVGLLKISKEIAIDGEGFIKDSWGEWNYDTRVELAQISRAHIWAVGPSLDDVQRASKKLDV